MNREIDITELAILADQFPPRLLQLGFRLLQVTDEEGNDAVQYVRPPTATIPSGVFTMGSDKSQDNGAYASELPQHTVTLSAYDIGIFPVTIAEYSCFCRAIQQPLPQQTNPYIRNKKNLDHPIVAISWQMSRDYVHWLAQVTGESWRLVTEAEWEKAGRGPDARIWPWGNEWQDNYANAHHEGNLGTTPVGSFPLDKSPYGLYDMAGNVREWTSSLFKPYPYQPTDGREDRDDTSARVARGGTWGSSPKGARLACRGSYTATGFFHIGFRVARCR